MPQLQTYKGEYLWKYIPNLPAAIIFTVLFAIITTAHTWKMFRTKIWFCFPFIIGGSCEVIGYISRAFSTYNTGSLPAFLMQAIFLLLPPVFFAATVYMVYSRVVRSVHAQRFSIISPRWCTRTFVLLDLTCLNIQSSGAGLLGNPDNVHIGDAIIVAGLGLQILVFVGFVYCCVRFHLAFRAHLKSSGEAIGIPWEPILNMLYGSSVVISVRNIFRLVEYIMGKDSYLFDHEWPTYVFDGVLMLIVMAVFFIWYPDELRLEDTTGDAVELRSQGNGSTEQQRLVKGNPA